MRILDTIPASLPDRGRPLMLAFGNFDGMHEAHSRLVGRVVERARAENGTAAILTFVEHPQKVLHPGGGPQLLNSPDYRLILLERMGVDLCVLLHFTAGIAGTDAASFVKDVLVKKLGVNEVYLGYNARFGKDRLGDASLMKRLGKEAGFRFEEIEAVEAGGKPVSSSRIRELVQGGRLDEAALCLGRPYSFLGCVVPGDGRGRKLGFPTANLDVLNEIRPPLGVYPVRVRAIAVEKKKAKGGIEFTSRTDGDWIPGLLNYGLRPTFKGTGGEANRPVAEVHLLDYEGDLYGKSLEVVMLNRLRGEVAFSGPEELKEQIRRDVEAARKAFAAQTALQQAGRSV